MNDNKGIVKSSYRPGVGSRIIHHLSPGMNTDPQAGQRFLGRGAPISSFNNPVIDDLQRDVFWYTFMKDMGLRGDVPDGRELNRKLLGFLQSDPNWENLSNWFSGRKLASAAVAYETTQRLLDLLDGLSSVMDALGQAESMEEQADDLDQQAEDKERQASGNSGQDDLPWDTAQDDDLPWDEEDTDDEDEPSPDDLREQADDLREQASKSREKSRKQQEKFDQTLEDSMSDMARSASVGAGQEFGEQVMAFMKAWGIDDGVAVELPIEDIKALMEMVGNPAFGQLSYLMGRIYDTSMTVIRGRSTVDLWEDEPGYTDDLSDIDLIELAKLSPLMPEPARMQSLQNFYKDNGMWGVTRSAQAMFQGTFIMAVDESESMNYPLERDESGRYIPTSPTSAVYSKALSLGLMNAARLTGQEFYAIGFASTRQITDMVSNRSSLKERMGFAMHHFNGGTDFTKPMNIALDIFDGLDEEGRLSSDILFVTDGWSELDANVVRRLYDAKDEYGVRLILLLIGKEPDYGGEDENICTHADIIVSFTKMDDTTDKIARALWDSR